MNFSAFLGLSLVEYCMESENERNNYTRNHPSGAS
jgi:hypothetical protein